MGFAIKAVHPTYWERHEPIEKPMLASAIYSQNITKELTEHKKLHSEIARIGESVRCEDRILK